MRWPRLKLSHAMVHLITVAIFLSMVITSYKNDLLSERQCKVIYHSAILKTMEAYPLYTPNSELKALIEFDKQMPLITEAQAGERERLIEYIELNKRQRAERAFAIAHHNRMRAKWERAVRNPWVEVEPDPPRPH